MGRHDRKRPVTQSWCRVLWSERTEGAGPQRPPRRCPEAQATAYRLRQDLMDMQAARTRVVTESTMFSEQFSTMDAWRQDWDTKKSAADWLS